MSVSNGNLFQSVLREILQAFNPLSEAIKFGTDGLIQLFLEIGYKLEPNEVDAVRNTLTSLPDNMLRLEEIAKDPMQLLNLIDRIREYNIADTIKNLNSIRRDGLGQRLLEYLFVKYLEESHGAICGALTLMGIVEQIRIEATDTIPGYNLRRIHWDRISKLSNPDQLLSSVYGWGTSTLDSERLLIVLRDTIRLFGIPAFSKSDSDNDSDKYLFAGFDLESHQVGAKIDLLPAVPENANNAGLSIVPTGITSIDTTTDLEDGWSVLIKIDASADTGHGILIRPGNVKYGQVDGSTEASATFDAILKIIKKSLDGRKVILFGKPNGVRLEATDLTIGMGIHPNQNEIKIEATSEKLQLVIDTSDADGFIRTIFGNQPQPLEFNGSLVWSSRTGIHFGGHDGLEMIIPINRTITSIKIHTLSLAIRSSNTGIDIIAGVTGIAQFGPLIISIDTIGMKLSLIDVNSNPGPGVGVLGNYDLLFAFNPPVGLGIAIDSQGVKGGGFIWKKENQYSGVIDLDLRGFAVQAIAILDTENLSFMLAVFADYGSGIQIGGGFRITKIGGFVGINRTLSLNDIAPRIQSGILNNILFPDNVIQNAPAIINEFIRIFPPLENQHLIGPAIRIVYGTPELIIADVAVILEFPNPLQLSIIGKISSKIPAQNSILEINIGILGEIDFDNGKMGLYGTLYNSRILEYTLSGDLAMSASWKEDRNFIFSLGGFNPRYQPPTNFPPFGAPPLKRLRIAFLDNVSFECYLALTTNTFQIGAKVDARFSGGGATISGNLSFDALIQFSPLYYIIDVAAGFSVRFKRRTLASISFSGTIEGPSPHIIKGKASFSILWWDVTVNVNVRFGRESPSVVELVDPWPELEKELRNNKNWSLENPAWSDIGVTISESTNKERDNGKLVVHPMGNLKVSQKSVPLNVNLSKFGAAKPINSFKFQIINSNVTDNISDLNNIQDYFAAGQFIEYDNAQKLTIPSFQLMDSGVAFGLGTSEIDFEPELVTIKIMEYETSFVIKNNNREPLIESPILKEVAPTFTPTPIQSQIFQRHGSAYKNSLKNNGQKRYDFDRRIYPKKRSGDEQMIDYITVNEDKYVIASKDNIGKIEQGFGIAPPSDIKEEENFLTIKNKLDKLEQETPENREKFVVMPSFAWKLITQRQRGNL
jgi:hypothetical protein